MDKATATADLLTAALTRLHGYGMTTAVDGQEVRLRKTTADAIVRIGYGGREVTYAVELKRGLRPNALGAVIHQVERLGEQGLLVADYVTPQMAEALRARGIPFVDAAGNAYLDQPPLLVWVKGELPKLGYVAEMRGKRRLLQRARLLQQWAEFYPQTLRPRLFLGRYHADTLEWWDKIDPTKYGAVLGGEPAGGRITGFLRPGTATFYAEKIDP